MTDLIENAPEYGELGKGLKPTPREPDEKELKGGNAVGFPKGGSIWGPESDDEKWPEPQRIKPNDEPLDPMKSFIHPDDFSRVSGDKPEWEEPPEWYGELPPSLKKHNRPLIVVPGILGTSLGVGSKRVWDPVDIVNMTLRDPEDIIRLKDKLVPFDGSATTSKAYADGRALVPGAYSGLMGFLQTGLGYKMGENLFTFAYSWTQSCAVSGAKLASFISYLENHKSNKDGKVDIICHSMGGLVTRAALNLYGKSAARVVYVASPHYGTPKAYTFGNPNVVLPELSGFLAQASVSGMWYYTYIKSFFAKTDVIDVGKFRMNLVHNIPTIHELMPDDYYFDTIADNFTSHQASVAAGLSRRHVTKKVEGLDSTYYNERITALPKMVHDMHKAAMGFKKSLGAALPGEKTLNIPALISENNTTGHVYFTGTDDPNYNSKMMGKVRTNYSGDGTVVYSSAKAPPGLYSTVYGDHVNAPNLAQTHMLIALMWAQNK